MGFSLSAGVTVVEKDFTSIVPAVSSSTGAFAGAFAWGPVLQPISVSNENDLVSLFGKPNPRNYISFFSAANFLSYSGSMLISRADVGAANACAEPSGQLSTVTVVNSSNLYHYNDSITFQNSPNGVTATASLTVTGGAITNIVPGIAGSGYSAGSIIISAPTGQNPVQATANPVFSGGSLASIVITEPGNGYISAPSIQIVGDGGGATAVATVGASALHTVTIVGPGTGYISQPTYVLKNATNVTISDPGLELTLGISYRGPKIKNSEHYATSYNTGVKTYGEFAAKYPGSLGNAIRVSVADAYNYSKVKSPTAISWSAGVATVSFASHDFELGHEVVLAGVTPAQYNGTRVITNVTSTSITFELGTVSSANPGAATVLGTVTKDWEYKSQFDFAPGTSQYATHQSGSNDEVHVIVVDRTGAISGAPGTVLEKFAYVSKASDAKLPDGANNYYADVLNERSKYVYWMCHPISADLMGNPGTVNWGQPALSTAFQQLSIEFTYDLANGVDGESGLEYTLSDAAQIEAYDLFTNQDLYDLSLIIGGKTSPTVAAHLIQNVAEVRGDCLAFVSPQNASTGAVILGNTSNEVNQAVAFRSGLPSSSYGVLDSGYKYQYDKYNDKYWWIPLNGDIAGLCARTDATNDPWYSPGGYTRGQIKSVVKLAMNADKTLRDTLYKNGINPVVTFPGQGTILYGDKTLLSKPSAFDRINVRRLFIVLERAISTAAKYQLFEINDNFTRAQFKGMVEPFLRDVQGRRGIYDFVVKCDATNNPGSVVDANSFVGDIYIKPAKSINFITLSFIAARTDVKFSEIGA